MTYCTARVDAVTNPSAHADQDVYLKALLATGSADWIEYGTYVARTKTGLLAMDDPKTRRPVVQRSGWPLMVRDARGTDVPNATFMVRYLHLEEKGSDVNLASHLLLDALSSAADAVVVVSNDSDLAFPIKAVRDRVPVGLVNPRTGHTAGDLKGRKSEGVGDHWWWEAERRVLPAASTPQPGWPVHEADGLVTRAPGLAGAPGGPS